MIQSNYRNLEHAINILRNPTNADKMQEDFNKGRFARVEKSIATRPVYIPFEFALDAVGRIAPYQDTTQPVGHDVIVTGIISDNSDRQIKLTESFRDIPYLLVGEKRSLQLNLSDIAGGTVTAVKGQKGIFTLPAPIIIRAQNRLSIDVYKTETTDDPETVNFVLTGYRVSENYQIKDAERKLVNESIAKRDLPRIVILKQEINFDSALAGGKARNVYFPTSDEPLLVRGCRTSLNHSLIRLGIEGEPEWTTKECPIWAIAQDELNNESSYLWFQRPVFLPARTVIEMSLENSINGVHIDPQNNNIISWICETV
jgi:hypothetical protein